MQNRRSTRLHQQSPAPNKISSVASEQKDGPTSSTLSAAEQQALDAATQLASFANMNPDYDATEGAGGLSISSYDSIDSDRSGLSAKGYPYHGKPNPLLSFTLCFSSILVT